MIMPSADAILIIIEIDLMLVTDVYDSVNYTPSIMYDSSAQVLEQRLYSLSISMVSTLKDILGRNVFVSGVNKQHFFITESSRYCHLLVISNIDSHHSDIRELFTSSPI